MTKITLAVMQADSVLGREIIEVLQNTEASWFTELRLFGTPDDSFVRFKNQDLYIREYTPDAFDGVDLAILGDSTQVEAGAVVVDVASTDRDPTAPVVDPEINPESVDDHRGIIYVPDGPSLALLRVANVLGDVDRLSATVLQPASLLGPKGIEELYAQARAVFNHEPLPESVLGGRLAFNILPGQPVAGYEAFTNTNWSTTSLLAPIFGGTLLTTDWQLQNSVDAATLTRRLEDAQNIELRDVVEPADVVGQSDTYLNVVQHHENHVQIVAAIDEIRSVAEALCTVGREVVHQDAF